MIGFVEVDTACHKASFKKSHILFKTSDLYTFESLFLMWEQFFVRNFHSWQEADKMETETELFENFLDKSLDALIDPGRLSERDEYVTCGLVFFFFF